MGIGNIDETRLPAEIKVELLLIGVMKEGDITVLDATTWIDHYLCDTNSMELSCDGNTDLLEKFYRLWTEYLQPSDTFFLMQYLLRAGYYNMEVLFEHIDQNGCAVN